VAEVRWSEESLHHLKSIHGHIADDSVSAAEAQIARITGAVDRLREFPRSGRMVPRVERDDVREVIVGNYRVAYELHEEDVTITAVHHGARPFNPSEPTG
jgi:addiction module RelE/StbE family toxin